MGLTPDFPLPAPDHLHAVALDHVLRKLVHQIVPRTPRDREGGAALVLELAAGPAPADERRRHVTQLDDRVLHARAEDPVVQSVDSAPVVRDVWPLAGDGRTYVVVEAAMEANSLDAQVAVHGLQLRLPVVAQAQRGVPAADGLLPEVKQWRTRRAEVDAARAVVVLHDTCATDRWKLLLAPDELERVRRLRHDVAILRGDVRSPAGVWLTGQRANDKRSAGAVGRVLALDCEDVLDRDRRVNETVECDDGRQRGLTGGRPVVAAAVERVRPRHQVHRKRGSPVNDERAHRG